MNDTDAAPALHLPAPVADALKEYEEQLGKAKGNVLIAQQQLDRARAQLHRVEGAIAATEALVAPETHARKQAEQMLAPRPGPVEVPDPSLPEEPTG